MSATHDQVPPETPNREILMARIFLREASKTRHREWAFTLLNWAGQRRRRAAELMRLGAQQKELFN